MEEALTTQHYNAHDDDDDDDDGDLAAPLCCSL
jgi:hypothetical protein